MSADGGPPEGGRPRVLVVEDDEDVRTQMKWALAGDYEVLLAGHRAAALDAVRRERPPLVALDLGLPPDAQGAQEGMRALAEILELEPAAKVVVITGREERRHALDAIGRGAYDYFRKPIDVDELKVVLRRACEVHRLEKEHRERQGQVPEGPFEGMLGTSPAMRDVFDAVRKVATTEVPVLVLGESGSGKELVARAIHRLGARRDGPFVAINCGAIPENLLESELFGHEKGAFTGAHVQRKGRIETANGGTLLLDEIGELSLGLQVKLLRFLQERRLERVGGRQEILVDARVLAATNADLEKAMAGGRFREDLYYRLAVVVISVPPLRRRAGDARLLAKAMLERYAAENRKRLGGFSEDALRALDAHEWPGNVREMENRIRRAVVMADGPRITATDLELGAVAQRPKGTGLREAREALERETIVRALARNKGNVSRTASELGVSRPTLYGMMDKLGVSRD